MALKWTDTLDIAIELDEAHPGVDPLHVNFVDLRNWVLALEDFVTCATGSWRWKILMTTRSIRASASWRPSRWPGSRNAADTQPGTCCRTD
jgi:FeS assembly protein IscX